MGKVCRSAIVAVIVCVSLSQDRALAGPYADEMGKCLVAATTDKDRIDLVRWLFAAGSLHPDISDVAAVSPEQRTEIFKSTSPLLERLLAEACPAQVRAAFQNEGAATLTEAFAILGRVAIERLTDDPNVSKGMGEMLLYMNPVKVLELLQPK
jgi:hypothetical protein